MPHIHTQPGQHDVTVSAWIFRRDGDELKMFVHLHRKMRKYAEVGGHMELDETPWQTIAHELEEESGYRLKDLDIYQPTYMPTAMPGYVLHPAPSLLVTYQPVKGHFHSDICYVFLAHDDPTQKPADGESDDTRWFTFEELERGAAEEKVLQDIVPTYRMFMDMIHSESIQAIPARSFSLDKPDVSESVAQKSIDREVLRVTRFGDPILREKARRLTHEDILSAETQELIVAMYEKLATNEYGVGLAAPQVGKNLALSVIGIKPTPTRPHLRKFNTVIINPSFECLGDPIDRWEGCVSCGNGNDTLYAQVPRYEKIQATWTDETAREHSEILDGFVAHVFQHETDHLNGVLFVDHVQDPTTYMMGDEYRKRVAPSQET